LKPNPAMTAAILLALLAALSACHLDLISDLLLGVIVLALLTVLIATEPGPGESGPATARPRRVPDPGSS